MQKLFNMKIQNMCFGKDVESEILSLVANDMTVEQFQDEVRKYDVCFNGCSQCGCDLIEGEDGFLTAHGTCNECAYIEEV